MTKSRAAALLTPLILCVCLLTSACDGATVPEGTTAPSGSESPGTTESAGPVDPDALAASVVSISSESIQALVALLEDKPEASTVLPQVQDLKESAIQSLVALGRQRETLSAADRSMVDSLEWSAFERLGKETWYATYNTLSSYYTGIDLEFGNLVASFNIITQYSDFGLLKKQLPAEATRLGIQ
jgi:hypothetical protein